jgi:hypothetical protein
VRIGYSAQHISQVEHGHTAATDGFVRACEAELAGEGALMWLLPTVITEQAQQRSARSAARRGQRSTATLRTTRTRSTVASWQSQVRTRPRPWRGGRARVRT